MTDKELTQALERVPPHSLDAEQSVLGALLVSRNAVVTVRSLLTGGDFYREAHRLIFEAVETLANKGEPADFRTVSEELRRVGRLEQCGGTVYLTELMDATPVAAHAEYYARKVLDTATLRRVLEYTDRVAGRIWQGGEEVDNVLSLAAQELIELQHLRQRGRGGLVPVSEVLASLYEELDARRKGQGAADYIPTGIGSLDAIIKGVPWPGLTVIGGRPAHGKTTLATQFAQRFAWQEHPGGVFSLEMPATRLFLRELAADSGVAFHRLRDGDVSDEEWGGIEEALNCLKRLPVWVDDKSRRIEDIEAAARTLCLRQQAHRLLIDYTQMVRVARSREKEHQVIAEVMDRAHELAKALNLAVILPAQLNREMDFYAADAILHYADTAIMIKHPENLERLGNTVESELVVRKNRHGAQGVAAVTWDRGSWRFASRDYTHAAEEPPASSSGGWG